MSSPISCKLLCSHVGCGATVSEVCVDVELESGVVRS